MLTFSSIGALLKKLSANSPNKVKIKRTKKKMISENPSSLKIVLPTASQINPNDTQSSGFNNNDFTVTNLNQAVEYNTHDALISEPKIENKTPSVNIKSIIKESS
jgi:hypothetical protein